jgi:hypothetical protein
MWKSLKIKFLVAYQRMKPRRGCVCQELESRVQSFGCPNDRNRENDPTPIRTRNTEEPRSDKNGYRSGGVNPRILLTANHAQNAANRMIKATDPTCKLEWVY